MQLTTKYYLPVPLFTFVAWLLLLLVTVSTPITKSIYLVQVTAQIDIGGSFDVAEANDTVRFGVYGWCSSGIHAEAIGGIVSDNEPAKCSPKELGYTFDSDVLSALHINKLSDDISSTVTFGLATNLVATVLAFVALLTSLVTLWRASRTTAAVTTIFLLLATLFALIAFIFDIVFYSVAKSALGSISGVSVKSGNGTWMTLTAFILLIITSFMSCIGCVRVIRARRQNNYDEKAARY